MTDEEKKQFIIECGEERLLNDGFTIDDVYSAIIRVHNRETEEAAKIKAYEKPLKRLKELGAETNFSLNDKGFGELFAEVYKDTCRYNATAKEWFFYDGKVWIRDEGSMRTLNKAKELADSLLIYATTIQDE